MNLEDELKSLTSSEEITNVQLNETVSNINESNFQQTQNMTQPVLNQQPVSQPSMVSVDAASNQTQQFNFSNMAFDYNKPVYDRNPLERLSGNAGESFRIRFIPGLNPSKVNIHYNAALRHNFVCLKNVYGTQSEDCCIKYGDSKSRMVIPVMVVPTIPGNLNQTMPNPQASLKALVLGISQYHKLQQQAANSGITDLTATDIIASVDNPQYKSFTFAFNNQRLSDAVVNVNDLINIWNTNAKPENVVKLCGRLITKEQYNAAYADYERDLWENTTPAYNNGIPAQGAVNQEANMSFGAFNMQTPQAAQTNTSFQQPTSQQGFGQPAPQQGFGQPAPQQGFGQTQNSMSYFNN